MKHRQAGRLAARPTLALPTNLILPVLLAAIGGSGLANAAALSTGSAVADQPADAADGVDGVSVGDRTAKPAQVIISAHSSAAGGYGERDSQSATRLDLSLRDTPQSVSVITRERLDDFHLASVNDALAASTGVTVEKVESDRVYYTARGYDITNFQYDGLGIPFVFGNVYGDLDTALYERIDVVRGANGLMSPTGNPSATVNFIRKRPTDALHASAAITLGSWHTRRLDADVSASLNEQQTLAGRLVVAHQDGDSYLSRYQPSKNLAYGILEFKPDAQNHFSIGRVYQRSDGKGGMWGALPLYYSDGSPTAFDVSASTSANWSNWATLTQQTFADYSHDFSNGWQTRFSYSDNTTSTDGSLLYVYGTPDRNSGSGLFSYPSRYGAHYHQQLADWMSSGKFQLGGRQHDLAFGLSWSRSELNDLSRYGQGIGTPMSVAEVLDGSYPQPAFDAFNNGSRYQGNQRTVYAVSRWNWSDDLKWLTGANYTRSNTEGQAYGVSQNKSAARTTPYTGLVYQLSPAWSAYASYSGIFTPQSETDLSGRTLAPILGKASEAGLKAELLDKRLQLSGALFSIRQDNAAEQAGMVANRTYYRSINTHSRGVELEAVGQLTSRLQASIGYTWMQLRNQDDSEAKTYLPRQLLRTAFSYQPAAMPGLRFGANIKWQSGIYRDQGAGIVSSQSAYAIIDAMLSYQINRQLKLAINLNNLANQKYQNSLYWSQAYYGAPRNGSATLSWTY